MKIIGLDPGLRNTGWGIIECQGNQLKYIAHGTVSSDAKFDLADRLDQLYTGLMSTIDQHDPEEAAVEETFVNKNPNSTLKLGMARGIVLLAPARAGLTVAEYSANRVKKAVVGAGHANKGQVEVMVQRLLGQCPSVKSDSADALAIAICHAHYRNQIQWQKSLTG